MRLQPLRFRFCSCHTDSSASVLLQLSNVKTRQAEACPNQKKCPTRKWGATPHPFSRRVPAETAWGGCPDLRHFADYSGGTVADSHGLPRFPCLNIVARSLCRTLRGVNSMGSRTGIVACPVYLRAVRQQSYDAQSGCRKHGDRQESACPTVTSAPYSARRLLPPSGHRRSTSGPSGESA
jgi:hypothetical protein